MIELPSYKTCQDCPLWESATKPGLPTRSHSIGTNNTRAILIVGEAPGYNEDLQFKSWVGQAGTILTRFIDASHLSNYADVYLANACRCRPPKNATPSVGHVNACRPHLQRDLDFLSSQYKEVIILCAGGRGALSVTKQQRLSDCLKMQGLSLGIFNGLKRGGLTAVTGQIIPVFFTYHPAMLLPFRKPELVTAVSDHFSLLLRYLRGEFSGQRLTVVPEIGVKSPQTIPSLVCVDIETYGILKGQQQTVFHPIKSEYVDKVPRGKQIVTVSFGYHDPTSPTGYRTFLYIWDKHLHYIQQWFKKLISSGTTLLGQNIKFDLLYLKHNDRLLNYLINPLRLKLDDTLLGSFLYYEQRPEKGLKELATLFGITDYRRLKVTATGGTARDAFDPDLHYYNCLDVATTLALYDFTWSEIEKKYGQSSSKLGQPCKDMRNQILWDVISLEMNGCAVNIPKLSALNDFYKQNCLDHIEKAKKHNLILKGTGSQKSCRKFVQKTLEELGLQNNSQVQLTEKKREVSVGIANFNFITDHSNESYTHWEPLQALKSFHKDAKIVNSYTEKLLKKPSEGIVYRRGNVGMTYSNWYPTAALAAKYEGGDTGGTIQGRFSCKKPASQTFPPSVAACITSRFPGGKIKIWDESQIELRVPTLLSGDPIMLSEWEQGIDPHSRTALLLWPDADPKSEEFLGPHGFRWCAKQLNFLVLYRGGAKKFQETILLDAGVVLPLSVCQAGIDRFDARYTTFRAWQDENINLVRKQGYLELPTGWSRFFGTGKAVDNCIPEICDFPIQTIAAQLLQSTEFEATAEIFAHHLKSVIFLQVHDSLFIDIFPGEEEIIDEIMEKHLTHPPLLGILEKYYGRTVPLEYEAKELK